MIYLIFLIYFFYSILFLFLPYLQGRQRSLDSLEKSMLEIKHLLLVDLKDRMELLKESLRLVDLEKQVGKLSHDDFIAIQKEIITEWDDLEKQLKQFDELTS